MLNKYQELKVGQRIEIHSYKHDGNIHRIWKHGYVVAVDDNRIVVVNSQAQVIESDGRVWYTKEPAVCYFYQKHWYNVISMLKASGVHYYCNIASPFIWDGEALKYIDYDLDLKVFPNNTMRILDEREYLYHYDLMHYSVKLDHILHEELEYLMKTVREKEGAFDRKDVFHKFSHFEKIQ